MKPSIVAIILSIASIVFDLEVNAVGTSGASSSRQTENDFYKSGKTIVDISIAATGLNKSDRFSNSDPMCVVYKKSSERQPWTKVFRTEMIPNQHNPIFKQQYHSPYTFEENTRLKFEMYDVDSNNLDKLAEHDFLGFAEISMGRLVREKMVQEYLLKPGREGKVVRAMGLLTVTGEILADNYDTVIVQFRGHNIEKKSIMANSPKLKLYRHVQNNKYKQVAETESASSAQKPKWKRLDIPMRELCDGKTTQSIKIECSSKSSFIGEVYVTLDELRDPNKSFALINPKKQKNSNYTNSGVITVKYLEIQEGYYSFTNYIQGGLDIQCTIAIDFTASNGDPVSPSSKHYINTTMNNYEEAIYEVVSILQDYDSDKKFPVYGFGAIINGGNTRHAFPVTLDNSNVECHFVDGVMSAYRACLHKIKFNGPTYFREILDKQITFMENEMKKSATSYFVLLILTDGEIHDMSETINLIIKASNFPLSIIIVGIGNDSFTNMRKLDGDEVALKQGTRDIVQFVPFRRMSREQLASEVLAEVPSQVQSYVMKYGVKPPALNRNYPVDVLINRP